MLTIKEKVDLIRDLCKKHDISSYELGKNANVSAKGAYNILNEDDIKFRNSTLNLVLDYIENKITGTNKKQSLKPEHYIENKVAETNDSYAKKVPYYDVEFAAGFEEFTQNQSINPTSYIQHPFFNGCDYVIRASGQSMAKVIKHGDAIGIIKLENWQEFLPFGEIYAIVTKDNYRMIKVITQGKTEDSFTLISKPSENKKNEFPPQQIKKSAILSIFKVQASSYLF